MNAHTLQFAADCGCPNPSPAQIKAFESIRQRGIREARAEHDRRKKVTDAIKATPAMISALMHPAQSIDEALEDVSKFILRYRCMPTWQRDNHYASIRKAKRLRAYCRFFRRFGAQIMAREAA